MAHETAGDPVSGLKWTRRTTAKLADELHGLGINVCPNTVARLLKAMGYSLRVNHKKLAGASHPNRDEQFRHIAEVRERCAADNIPLISVDTKKKELVGTFRNPGAKWDRSPELVNDHDFRSDAHGLAVPYGIYDPRTNAGTVFVGTTADTPAFAVDCIEKWWSTEGRKHYPDAKALQILADGGGSNSCTARAWKFNLQHRLCNRHGLRVTVAHYPPATSKWNPIEHRLFCEISKNWAGRPLDSFDTILKYLRTTRTATGLRVRAHLVRKPTRPASRSPTPKCESFASRRTTSCPNGTTPLNPCRKTEFIFASTRIRRGGRFHGILQVGKKQRVVGGLPQPIHSLGVRYRPGADSLDVLDLFPDLEQIADIGTNLALRVECRRVILGVGKFVSEFLDLI